MSECKREKMKNRYKNYNSSNKTKLKIFSNVRGQYLCRRAKPRGITLNIMQERTSLVTVIKRFR